jgi:hypothetical protein
MAGGDGNGPLGWCRSHWGQFFEHWVEHGTLRVLRGPAGVLATYLPIVVGGVFYATHQGSPGALWWLVAGLVVTLVLVALSAARHRIRADRAHRRLAASGTTESPSGPRPDLEARIAEGYELADALGRYKAEGADVEKWIEDVRGELMAWRPSQAVRFSPPKAEMTYPGGVAQAVAYVLTGPPDHTAHQSPESKRLNAHVERLAAIAEESA